jgi:putative DNA-invertase from lambdoid prophage Rac
MSDKAIYVRVSTRDQHCEIQLAGLEDLMKRYGWPTYRTYIEKLSGKEGLERPELNRMMEDAKKGEINVVVVWAMSRFGRSTFDSLGNIRLLDSYNCRFICPKENIDTDNRNPTAKFLLTILAAVAQLDRDYILERTQDGYADYRADFAKGRVGVARHSKSGKDLPVGRPKKVFHRGRISAMLAKGMSRRAIAKELSAGQPKAMQVSEKTVRRLIQEMMPC